MKNRIIIIKNFAVLLFCCFVVIFGCKEEARIDFIDDSAPAPAQVTDVTIRETAGGAVLKYKVPVDKNLLYVRAEYEIRPGVMREAKSSYVKDSLVLEGFGDERTYDVLLYSVGRNEKASEPYPVKVTPKKAPVHLASKSLRETFGGVAIDFKNPEKSNLAMVLMADTSDLGYKSDIFTFYTSKDSGYFTYRGNGGLAPVPTDFGVYFRDRWGNLSDTVYANRTPWFEEYIPKPWTEYKCTGDLPQVSTGWPITRIWDEDYSQDGFHGNEQAVLPHHISWDFGKTVKLSRITYWPRKAIDDRWIRGHAKVFEIWGAATAPRTDASYDDWTLLGRFECVKPSGPGAQITQEDIDFSDAGIEFDFLPTDLVPDPYIPVRFIRWRTISTYANSSVSTVHIRQLSFWGEIIE